MRLPIMVAYLAGLLLPRAAPSQDATAAIGSVRVALSTPFDTKTIKPGDVFHLHSLEPLQASACTLARNTEIVGRVDSISRTPEGPGKITVALRFDPFKCSGKSEEQVLPLLVAMQNRSVQDNPERVPLSTAALQYLVAARHTMIGPSPNSDVMLATRDAMSAGTREDGPMVAGQVEGIHGLQLWLPEITPATTLVFSQDSTLPNQDTTLYLAFVPTPPGATIAASPSPLDETEACVAPGCSALVAPTSEVGNGNVLWSVALAPLGFEARPAQQGNTVGNSVSLHFLGQDQLLLTFPLHTLLQRTPQTAFGATSRLVRAVLLSRQDGQVLKTADWQVPLSQGPYVWSFGRDSVLAQVGAELILFGRNLEPERRFTLSGPLASLSAAPAGESILLTTVHEKHTPKEHPKLVNRRCPDQPIDEDYELAALDSHLSLVATRMLHGSLPQLALLSSGTVSTQLLLANVWQINRTSASGANTVLARVKSSCPLHVQSLRGNLILAEGCRAEQPHSKWYRVLNEKGAILLDGGYDGGSLLLKADIDSSGRRFGIASVHVDQPMKGGASMRTRDSMEEAVDVYRSDTGELQFATTVAIGSAEQNNFAISPEGNVLTVLTKEQVRTFELPSSQKEQKP